MDKKTKLIFVGIFIFFYVFNYLTPLSFGDDYVYSFIWQGRPMYVPLSENAVRVSTWSDLFASQLSHYLTGNGRLISHSIAQFFLWIGKSVFNIINALVAVLLIAEIYWCSNKGKVSFHFKRELICWIFFALWVFSPGFSPVFFWLSGACNYLWTTALLLLFLLPYIHKYYAFNETFDKKNKFKYGMFFLGIMAGWTNENSICWIILVLFVFILRNRKKEVEFWLYTGLAGLIIGYALLVFSPGNAARLHMETGGTNSWLLVKLLKQNIQMLAAVFLFQFFLWYFNIRTLLILQQRKTQQAEIRKDFLIVKTLCAISFGMTAVMLLAPVFPPRSSFPGTVQLIIASCIIMRIQKEYKIEVVQACARKLLCVVGLVYFIMTASASLYGFYDYYTQMQELLYSVKKINQAKENVITVKPIKKVCDNVNYASGLHLINYDMSEDENDWRNVAFARYYGIKGIRMEQNCNTVAK